MPDCEQACRACLDTPGSVFQDLTYPEKEKLARAQTTRFFKKSEVIYREGEKPVGLLCLLKGK